MNFRLTAILFGTILILGVVLLVLTFTDDKSVSTESLLTELAGTKSENVTAVEFEREDGKTLKLVRSGKDRWDAEWDAVSPGGGKQPIKVKADPFAVGEIVTAMLKLKPTEHKDFTATGLNPPSLKVTLREGEKSATVSIGDVQMIGGSKAVAFVSTSAQKSRPMAVLRSAIDPLLREGARDGRAGDLVKWSGDFRVKTIFAAEARGAGDDVALVKLSLPAKKKELALVRSGGGWKFETPAGWGEADASGEGGAATGITGVKPLLSTLTSLQAMKSDDFVEAPTLEQMKQFGLDDSNPDRLQVTIANRDGETTTVLIGKKEGAAPPPPMMPGMPPQPPTGKVWVQVVGQAGAIRANAGDISGLVSIVENPDPLRDRTLLAVDKSRIDGLDVVFVGQPDKTTKLRKHGPAWSLYGNPAAGDPQPAAKALVDKILDAITERRTIKGFPVAAAANFVPPEIKVEIKVYSESFDPPADANAEPILKKDAKPPIRLLFGRKDGDTIYVRRTLPDGSEADFTFPASLKLGLGGDSVDVIATLAKTRLELLDPNLKSFAATLASKLTVSGGTIYDLDKDEKPNPSTFEAVWTFTGPPDQKGRTADAQTVMELLTTLGNVQSVTRFVDETPTPAKLVEYGLAAATPPPPNAPPSPRLKVVVGIKGTDPTDKERVYEFGTETADANFVYARQAGKAAVFTVPKAVVDKFKTADLRDRAIFRFDPTQVKAIKIKGWKEKLGGVGALNLEKNKDGVWVATMSPTAGYVPDAVKVAMFLNGLSRLRVKSFVAGPQLPAHGFPADQQGLDITLEMQSGPGVAINIAAPTDGGAAYFGWTSALPQTAALFTVDAAAFKAYKEGPAAFAK